MPVEEHQEYEYKIDTKRKGCVTEQRLVKLQHRLLLNNEGWPDSFCKIWQKVGPC